MTRIIGPRPKRVIRILPIAGTWARKRRDTVQWFNAGSPLHRWLLERHHLLRDENLEPVIFDWLVGEDGQCFEWTTDLNGWQAWRRLWPFNKWTRPSFGDWEVGGINLYHFLCAPFARAAWYPSELTHVLGHSHALPVIANACKAGLKINVLITVCSPVRFDPEMVEAYEALRRNVRYWVHFYSDDNDRIQILGEAGDAHLGRKREHPLADRNIFVPGGHSGVLNDPELFGFLIPALEEVIRRHGKPDTRAA